MKKSFPALFGLKRIGSYHHGWMNEPTWGTSIHLVWPVNSAQLESFLKKEFNMDGDMGPDDWAGRCVELFGATTGKQTNVIALQRWDATPEAFDMLSHECLHCADHILAYRGVPLNRETCEVYAYLLGSLVGRSVYLLNQVKPSKRLA